jgi:hypothetical protein
MARIRLGFAFEERARTRLKQLADLAGISQNQALEALIVGSGLADAHSTVMAGKASLQVDRDLRLGTRRSLAKMTAADYELIRIGSAS